MRLFRYVDVFTGLGGFHDVMSRLGGECVLAIGIYEETETVYKQNYGEHASENFGNAGSIEIPDHELLCASLPDENFSSSGNQNELSSNLIDKVIMWIKGTLFKKKPGHFLIDCSMSVHPEKLDHFIQNLDKIGYSITVVELSPHEIGIPQKEKRLYIQGIRDDIENEDNETGNIIKVSKTVFLKDVLEEYVESRYYICSQEKEAIDCWDEFVREINLSKVDFSIRISELNDRGINRKNSNIDSSVCCKNKYLYIHKRNFINKWLNKWNSLNGFERKMTILTWKAGDSIRSIWDGIIHFSQYGIIVYPPSEIPIPMTFCQAPVIGALGRRMTPREFARLRGISDTFLISSNINEVYRQLFFTSNNYCIEYLTKQLFEHSNLKNDCAMLEVVEMSNVIPMQIYIEDATMHTEYAPDSVQNRNYIDNKLIEVLGANYTPFQFYNRQQISTGKYLRSNGEKVYLITANVTFMGGQEGQHPLNLKRIQYNNTWRDFYEKFKSEGKVLWMGLYSYKGINIWAIFEPDTYLKKHEGKSMTTKSGIKSNYSCHIYLNDLYQGYVNGYYYKMDKNGNIVGAVRYNFLANYLNGDELTKNPIIEAIDKINTTKIKWHEWITVRHAIPYMKGLKNITGFKQWKQNLWNGWYIEALYSEYFFKNPSPYIDYVATTNNQEILIEYKNTGLDLAFPQDPFHFIGDLKAVCEGEGNTLLNDERKVKAALDKYKRIWFVIYIHEKKSGKTNDYEMVKWRNEFILAEDEWDYKKHPVFDPLSAPQTPHSVAYSEMVIIELNEITKDQYFSIGPQWGLNSDGNKRNDKFKISKKMLETITDDGFVIYRYRP